MMNVFFSILNLILQFLLILLIPVFAFLFVEILLVIFHIIVLKFKGYKRVKAEHISINTRESFFKKILVLLPKQFALDFMTRQPDEFNYYGLHMFCGEQGAGKTISVIEFLLFLQSKYPKLKVRTNMYYKYQDSQLYHWKQLIKNDNGIYGQVEVIDELQTWFSSNESKNFPPSMLTEISQQRKQRKMLIGTAQVFGRIAKPIREQVTFVYLPRTYFGCLTIVKMAKASDYDYELNRFKKIIKRYWFVHNEKIRNAYDTFAKIERYKDIGFQENNIFIDNSSSTIINQSK